MINKSTAETLRERRRQDDLTIKISESFRLEHEEHHSQIEELTKTGGKDAETAKLAA
jgi:hypothetical protein